MKSTGPNPFGFRQAAHERREQKRADAAIREDLRYKRTDSEQLNLLIDRGAGECKEARRLKDKIYLEHLDSPIIDYSETEPDEAPDTTQPKRVRAARKRRNKPASLM